MSQPDGEKNSRRVTPRQKVLLVAASVLFTFVLLEAALRAGGFLVLKLQDFHNRAGNGSADAIRILCVGESTTALGADPNAVDTSGSYPSQLEDILNASSSRKFKVINKGVSGTHIEYITVYLEQWLEEYRPDFLAVMAGINDGHRVTSFQRAGPGLFRFFKHLRVGKLAGWIGAGLTNRHRVAPAPEMPEGWTGRSPESREDRPPTEKVSAEDKKLLLFGLKANGQKHYQTAEQIFGKLIMHDFDRPFLDKCFLEMIKALRGQGKYGDAAVVFEYWFRDDPYNAKALRTVDEMCFKKEGLPEMITGLKRLIAANPGKEHFYASLGGCYAAAGRESLAEANFQKAREIRSESFNPWVKENYYKILESARERGVRPVVIQYPVRSIAPLQKMLADAPGYDSLIFVDNEKKFKDAIGAGKYEDYFWDRFASDFGHCTLKGNRLLAQNVADQILKSTGGHNTHFEN